MSVHAIWRRRKTFDFAFAAAAETVAGCEGHGSFDGPAVSPKTLERLDVVVVDAVLDAAPA